MLALKLDISRSDLLVPFYRRAEQLYAQCSYTEHTEGVSRLIQELLSDRKIDEVIRCFLCLLDLHRKANNVDRYIQSLNRTKLFNIDEEKLHTIVKDTESLIADLPRLRHISGHCILMQDGF